MLNEWRLALYMVSVGVNMRVLIVRKTTLSSSRQAASNAASYWKLSSTASRYDIISVILRVCSTICNRTKHTYIVQQDTQCGLNE